MGMEPWSNGGVMVREEKQAFRRKAEEMPLRLPKIPHGLD
jgi:hypothetical protein